MPFAIDHALLDQARARLIGRDRLYWIVGGAGSGKTTLCQALSASYGMPLYDMDAQIYGAYHARFTAQRHPVNTAWASAPDGLAWLLAMSWEEFDAFNRAALPEYLDLLAEDLAAMPADTAVLIDGGICNPGLAAQAIPPSQMVCLVGPERTSAEIWEGSPERLAMKEMVDQLEKPAQAWRRFLAFDAGITRTIFRECQESQIAACAWTQGDSVQQVAERVARELGLG